MHSFPKLLASTCAIVCALVSLRSAQACTAFELNDNQHIVFGRNYDWSTAVGLAMVNQRGLNKSALLLQGGEPLQWVSRYGSLTFNQYGREMPNGGINEKGLIIEVLWLESSRYPSPDKRPTLNPLTWIQYQLDTAASVNDVIASDSHVRVSPEYSAALHYLICERGGRCATVEFVDGKMLAHTDGNLPLPVLTNNTYDESIRHMKSLSNATDVGDEKGYRNASLSRFGRAAIMLKAYQKKPSGQPVDYAFDVLDEVTIHGSTKWSIVYDETAQQVHFRTLGNSRIRTIDLAALDFTCVKTMKMLDMNASGSGNVTKQLRDYSAGMDRSLIELAFRHTSLTRDMPQSVVDIVVKHADGATCAH
ncbi:MAG TPA: linear amide C-N hydrolase [Burkholderiaceae bacterium]